MQRVFQKASKEPGGRSKGELGKSNGKAREKRENEGQVLVKDGQTPRGSLSFGKLSPWPPGHPSRGITKISMPHQMQMKEISR